jgi:hypothetical protein
LTRPIPGSGFDPPARPIRVWPARAPAPRGPCPSARIHIRTQTRPCTQLAPWWPVHRPPGQFKESTPA